SASSALPQSTSLKSPAIPPLPLGEGLRGEGLKRLVLTVGRGKPKYAEMALGLGRSLSLIGDDTPRAVVTDLATFPWTKHFQKVIPPIGKRSAIDKLLGLELTDADAILAIDSDCLAFRRF